MHDADILVVEDERIVALHVCRQLMKLGYRVAGVASSGTEALRLILELRPAVVLMDIHIDGPFDGIETASRLPEDLDTFVVYISAYTEEATLERARATSPYGYLVKPFSERELHATIQMALERRRLDRELRAAQELVKQERDAAQHYLDIATAHNKRVQELQAELAHVRRLTELGQVVSTLVHEVSQPIAAIKTYLNACRRVVVKGNQPEIHLALGRIEEQTNRTSEIIRRISDYVKKRDVQMRPESLSSVVEEAVELTRSSIRGNEPTFAVQVDLSEQQVQIDRIQVQQVLFNLIRNGLEAMQNRPRCDLAITAKEAADGMVVISVADTGPGIPDAVRSKVFQPFVTTKSNGMGVGLSVCQRIVELHGGRLWVDDNTGGGTVFRFTVRRVIDRAPLVASE
jgi:C4-dicarboxylate-specific signal transduction histidine kinase